MGVKQLQVYWTLIQIPLNGLLVFSKTEPNRSQERTGDILLEIFDKSGKKIAFNTMFSGKCQSFISKYGLPSENLECFSRRIVAAKSKLM